MTTPSHVQQRSASSSHATPETSTPLSSGEDVIMPSPRLADREEIESFLEPLTQLRRPSALLSGETIHDYHLRILTTAEKLIKSPAYQSLPSTAQADVLIAGIDAAAITGEVKRADQIKRNAEAVIAQLERDAQILSPVAGSSHRDKIRFLRYVTMSSTRRSIPSE